MKPALFVHTPYILSVIYNMIHVISSFMHAAKNFYLMLLFVFYFSLTKILVAEIKNSLGNQFIDWHLEKSKLLCVFSDFDERGHLTGP